jgi:hypothetical protein
MLLGILSNSNLGPELLTDPEQDIGASHRLRPLRPQQRTFQIHHYANHDSLGFGRFGSGNARTPCILAAICSSFFEIISLAPEFSG